MNGIANIQNAPANFMLRLDSQDPHIDELTKEIRAKNGINDRLENVQYEQERYIKYNHWSAINNGEGNNKTQGLCSKSDLNLM